MLAALLLGWESASAAPLPFFYLVPTGPTTVPTVVPAGTSTYQLWVDPSGINAPAPGCTTPGPINGGCVGTFGIGDNVVLAEGSLTMTAFSPNTGAPAFTSISVLNPTGTKLQLPVTGDPTNGNDTPFEIGTMTITNDGSGPGDVTLWSGDYIDANFTLLNDTVPQLLAVAAPVPEPRTLLLLGAGLGGLSVASRARRPRMN